MDAILKMIFDWCLLSLSYLLCNPPRVVESMFYRDPLFTLIKVIFKAFVLVEFFLYTYPPL